MASARSWWPHAIFASLLAFAIGLAVPAALLTPLPDGPNDFNSPGFVASHAWVKFAMLAARPAWGRPSAAQEDADVARYFALNAAIAAAERTAGDPASDAAAAAADRTLSAALRSERAGIENEVELILEGRLTRVIKQAGLTRDFGARIVWPPVNIEFQNPPSVLVTSPRGEIRKQSESLLQADLPIERVQRIEADAERDGATSALVVEIGGIATYPAIIPEDADYHFIMQDIAHEWTHHYLYFTPLGRRYFSGAKLTTLNETVANMVGRELGDMLVAEYPLPTAPTAATSGGRLASPPAIDFTKEMRGLRVRVEALLRDGKIAEAEQAMKDERQYLAANGYYIRRLNQAYFAFHGSYADSAGSIDPIGPKLDALRKRSASLREFVGRARALTSEADLDAAIASE